MSTFSPTEAALEGVRISRERPRALLIWAACSLAFTLLLSVVADLTLGANAKALLQEAQQSSADSEDFDRLMKQIWPFVAVGYPLWLAFQAMLSAALYRAVLSPSDSRIGLRLGRDEARLLALGLIKTAIVAALLFVAVFSILVAGIGAGGVAGFLGMLAKLALIWVGILAWIRLSLAGPATCARDRLVVFDSWTMTKGQFWRLLGGYLMAFAIGVVVLVASLLILLVIFGVLLSTMGVTPANLATAGGSPLVLILSFVAQALISLVFIGFRVITVSPAAEAYRELVAGA